MTPDQAQELSDRLATLEVLAGMGVVLQLGIFLVLLIKVWTER